MALTEEQVKNLQQGDLVLYVAGSGDGYIEAEATVDNLDDEFVAITLSRIIDHGSLIEQTRWDSMMATPDELTLQ